MLFGCSERGERVKYFRSVSGKLFRAALETRRMGREGTGVLLLETAQRKRRKRGFGAAQPSKAWKQQLQLEVCLEIPLGK